MCVCVYIYLSEVGMNVCVYIYIYLSEVGMNVCVCVYIYIYLRLVSGRAVDG